MLTLIDLQLFTSKSGKDYLAPNPSLVVYQVVNSILNQNPLLNLSNSPQSQQVHNPVGG